DSAIEAHGAGDPELAAVRAGAAHDVGDLMRPGIAELELPEPLPDVVERLVAHPAEDDVLLDRGARVAAAEVPHDLCDAAELLGRQVAAGDLHGHCGEALLALRLHVGFHEAVELAAVAVGRAVA